MNLIKAMVTVAGLTGVSRIAGFARDILMASILGAGPVADAFFVALKLPNFFRRVTAEGAFSVSFVPVYSEALEKDGQDEASGFASDVFSIMLVWLGAISLVLIAVMPFVLYVVAPGFIGDEVRYDLAVELSRITFPYLLFMSLTALLGGVLNAVNRFAPFAFAPVLFNLCLIAALLLGDLAQDLGGTTGHALAYGVFAAGIVQFVWLFVSAARAGIRVRLRRLKLTAPVRKVLKLMGPGVIGAGVMHINLFADVILASFLGTGAISYLYYADRLNQLPLGIVGIAVGTALLPMLSKAVAAKQGEEANGLFNRALEYCFFLGLPASLALGFFGNTIISVLFERGAFDAAATTQTSAVLMAYALGLSAYITIKVFSTVHWAHQDTTTPVRISVIATVLNIGLSLVLIQFIGVAGIALGTAVTGWLQFVLHWRALKGKAGFHFDARFRAAIVKIIVSSVVMIVGIYVGLWALDVLGVVLHKVLGLVFIVGLGGLTYFTCVVALGVLCIGKTRNLIRKN